MFLSNMAVSKIFQKPGTMALSAPNGARFKHSVVHQDKPVSIRRRGQPVKNENISSKQKEDTGWMKIIPSEIKTKIKIQPPYEEKKRKNSVPKSKTTGDAPALIASSDVSSSSTVSAELPKLARRPVGYQTCRWNTTGSENLSYSLHRSPYRAMDSKQNSTCTRKDIECGEENNEKVSQLNAFGGKLKMIVCAGLAGAAVAIGYYLCGWPAVIPVSLVALIIYLVTGRRWRWFYVAAKTIKRDLTALVGFIKLVIMSRSLQKGNVSIVEVFRRNAAKFPDKTMIVFEGTEWTFKDVDDYSNQVAHVFKSEGFRKGDIVALFLENRPEFIGLWLGLAKIGVIVPLINYQLRQESLLHSFSIGKAQAVIFGSELSSAMQEIAGNLGSSVGLYRWTDKGAGPQESDLGKNLNELIAAASKTVPELPDKLCYTDKILYIYTSGTTGLPKAAVITGARYIFLAGAMHNVVGFRQDDRFYTPLPLFHTAGGCLVVGQALIFGASIVIRRKFSASSYFDDCRESGATVAQYIGEMCRYILSTPAKPEDKDHKVRIIFGNGLRPQIWKPFVERFNIPRVAEFYGATEGNANIVNVDNTFGAIGFVSRIVPSLYPISIIKADPDTGEPIRGPDGLCQVCGPDEPGVFIGKIIVNDPSREFLGYVDKSASEKKVVRDVFTKGDAAFLSGDVIVSDEFGYLYFRDRIGDTFRWKGENVSTTEVEAIVSNLVNYRDSIVYGVEIQNQEGRVGMAAILDHDNALDLVALAEGLSQKLPPYARPQIIRRLEKVDVTGTFKLKKVELQKEGYDPRQIKDKLYYWSNGKFELLTAEAYDAIQNGKIRF